MYPPPPSQTRAKAHSPLWMRIRAWLTVLSLAGLAVVYVVPQAPAMLNAATADVLRQAMAQAAAIAGLLRPLVHALTGMTLLVWLVSWWAYRQRRRITEQVARLLKLYPDNLRTRVVVGLSAPFRAKVRLPAGVTIKDSTWTELREEIRKGWNYAYTVRRDPRWDRLVLVRPWRRGADRSSAATARPYASQAHARLDAVRDSLPFQVRTIEAGEVDPELGQPAVLDVYYASTMKAAHAAWQEKVGEALTGLTGRAPEGHQWTTEWFPEQDRVRLALTEAPPQPRELERFLDRKSVV